MDKFLACLGLYFFSAAFYQVSGQTIPYKAYTAKDGMSNSRIYRAKVDNNGFLWMTSNYGIIKYDGFEFKNYFPNNLYNSTFGICVDSSNAIWVADYAGNIYTITDAGAVVNVMPDYDVQKAPLYMECEKSGIVWIVHKNGSVSKLRPGNDNFYLYQEWDNIPLHINNIFRNNAGDVFFTTDRGVFKPIGNTVVPAFALLKRQIYSIAQSKDGTYYLGGNGMIYILKNNAVDSIRSRINKPVNNIVVTTNGDIWLTFMDVFGFYRMKDSDLLEYSHYVNMKKTYVNALATNENGDIFLATSGEGLFVLNNTNVVTYKSLADTVSVVTHCLETDQDGTIYVGGIGTMAKFDGDKFTADKRIAFKENERVYSVLFTDKSIWVGSQYNIFRYDLKSGRTYNLTYGALDMALTPNNEILIGTYKGVLVYNDSSSLKDTAFYHLGKLDSEFITTVYRAPDSSIFFITDDNLVLREYPDGRVLEYDSTNSPVKHVVMDIVMDEYGNIWFGTVKGLICRNPNGKWKEYNKKDGLGNIFCKSIYYNGNRLWIGTMQGLYCYNYSNRKIARPLYTYDVLTEEINDIVRYDDDLWISTTSGVLKWNFSEDRLGITTPAVVVTAIQSGGVSISPDSDIVLPYANNSLSIRYVAPEFIHQKALVYQYRINTDTLWNTVSSNTLEFSSLSPGSYHLTIRAQNQITGQVSKETNITFQVLKPFWLQIWFIFTCVILVLAFVYMLFRHRMKIVRNKEKKRSKAYAKYFRLKYQAASALINPHFIFNSLNSIQSYINKSDKLSANKYLSNFAKLIRATMDNTAKIYTSLEDETDMISRYLLLEKMRLGDKLEYSIETGENLSLQTVHIPSMIIQPYIENAVWHGITPANRPGKITLKINMHNTTHIHVIIEDNGVGFEPLPPGSKNAYVHGMGINSQRLKIVEILTRKKVVFQVAHLDPGADYKGTRISILIPYKQHTGN